MWRRATCVACVVAGWAGCLVPDRPIAIVNEECLEEIDVTVVRHACQHGRLGPYTMVDAVAIDAIAPPTVDAAQRVLAVKLPPIELDPDGTSYLRYVATRAGQHAVFVGAASRTVSVAIGHAGRQLPLTRIEPVQNPSACGGMLDVTGVELAIGEEYVLVLGPTNAGDLRLFIEHLPTFGKEWSDRCVD